MFGTTFISIQKPDEKYFVIMIMIILCGTKGTTNQITSMANYT